MFYNHSDKLADSEFKNPGAEYRGAPFWAWNCKPDKEMLLTQIEAFKEMGFGGFIIHSREGMALPYLQTEFMEAVKLCVSKAKDEELKAWLYDEDRWPSGSAGGYVTREKKYRRKLLRFTCNKETDGIKMGSYSVELDKSGGLKSYSKSENGTWYAFLQDAEFESRYNGYTDADTLMPEAIAEFIKQTHEKYKTEVGREFSKTIPAIFTDEPQLARKTQLKTPFDNDDVIMPWTSDFTKTFKDEYDFDILEYLPEIVWDLPGKKASRARYCYHNHICDRFMGAFAAQLGNWCKENNIMLTGHFLQEESLFLQTISVGDVMRGYPHFQLPGMDLLCNHLEYTTAKQVQSVVRQYGKCGMLSEMYGVTNWDFDFRGHKFQGDWQAAMGVTVRVPHLTWMSMKGSAKRDYPASIGMQSPWYKEYSYIENHFARVNAALTRGKAIARIGVIHPIESYWLHFGPESSNEEICRKKQTHFENVTEWLLFGLMDFDFINEALLGRDSSFVREMEYDTVIVPACETLRSTTVNYLEEYISRGGRVIFMGKKPEYIDSAERGGKDILPESEVIPFEKNELLEAVKELRLVDISENNKRTDNLIYHLRRDGSEKWLFIAHAKYPDDKNNLTAKKITVAVKGKYAPVLYDTQSGEIKPMSYSYKKGQTVIEYDLYDSDSLLIKLTETDSGEFSVPTHEKKIISSHKLTTKGIRRTESNVLLLDRAEYAFMDEELSPEAEEVLRLDAVCREKAGLPPAYLKDIQPWCDSDKSDWADKRVRLRFRINSESEVGNVSLAFENAVSLSLNGENVDISSVGAYVDLSIKIVKLPNLKKGENILCAEIPFGRRAGAEAMYLLGDFSAEVNGSECVISNTSYAPSYGSVTKKGMPFYGANLVYETEFTTEKECVADIAVPEYIGSLVKVFINGDECGNIVYSPYKLTAELKKGVNKIEFMLYGNRHNTFGSLHNCSDCTFYGPYHWRGTGDDWTYDYLVKDFGIMKEPTVTVLKYREGENQVLETLAGECS